MSATDPTLAPEGQDVFYLHGPAPVDAHQGWETGAKECGERLVASAGSVYEGPSELEIGRFQESPRDLERRLGAVNGCICHVDQTLTRLGLARPGPGLGRPSLTCRSPLPVGGRYAPGRRGVGHPGRTGGAGGVDGRRMTGRPWLIHADTEGRAYYARTRRCQDQPGGAALPRAPAVRSHLPNPVRRRGPDRPAPLAAAARGR